MSVLELPATDEYSRAVKRMEDIIAEKNGLVDSIKPSKNELESLYAQLKQLFEEKVEPGKEYVGERTARLAEISADMNELFRKMQVVVETLELLNQEYSTLSNLLKTL